MLTPQMIYEFVDKIVVHSPIKVDGEREQQVDIYLKFIGNSTRLCRSLPRKKSSSRKEQKSEELIIANVKGK